MCMGCWWAPRGYVVGKVSIISRLPGGTRVYEAPGVERRQDCLSLDAEIVENQCVCCCDPACSPLGNYFWKPRYFPYNDSGEEGLA